MAVGGSGRHPAFNDTCSEPFQEHIILLGIHGTFVISHHFLLPKYPLVDFANSSFQNPAVVGGVVGVVGVVGAVGVVGVVVIVVVAVVLVVLVVVVVLVVAAAAAEQEVEVEGVCMQYGRAKSIMQTRE